MPSTKDYKIVGENGTKGLESLLVICIIKNYIRQVTHTQCLESSSFVG